MGGDGAIDVFASDRADTVVTFRTSNTSIMIMFQAAARPHEAAKR
jgi:hypothetical protein